MRKSEIIGILATIVLFYLSIIGAFFWRAYADNESIPGHIIRRLKGETGAEIGIHDLAQDIRTKPGLAQIQPWAVNELARYRAGQIQINTNEGTCWNGPGIRLAKVERPDFINKQWGETNEWGEECPELYLLGPTNEPESVGIIWGYVGVVVGQTNYPSHEDDWMAWECVTARPGIYAFYQYK